MKLSEFQEKLTTVSDAKLRLMLADSRRKGPEVAVKLILAEAERRGVDLNAVPDPAVREEAGPGAEAGFPAEGGAETAEGAPAPDAAGAGMPEAAPAGKGAWLAEEANQGMPVFVKVLLTVVVLGGILIGLFLLLGRQ